jgi:hypothetical protein
LGGGDGTPRGGTYPKKLEIVCLVFVVVERLTGEHVWAFVAGALFGLHPVHTEWVDWISGVTDLELTFFYLITFLPPLTTRRFWLNHWSSFRGPSYHSVLELILCP